MTTVIAIVVVVVLFVPILWQIPKAVWPVRLNRSGTRFTGLYRRWRVKTVIGRVSDHQSGSSSRTMGHITAYDYGGVISVHDGRRRFQTQYDSFNLTDASGATYPVRTANLSPALGAGHLVSAAVLEHWGKPGYAFLVYDHTTGQYWTMQHYRRGLDVPPQRSLTRMVFHLGAIHQAVAILCAGLGFLLGALAHVQLATFNKLGLKPLLRQMEERAGEESSSEAQARDALAIPPPPARLPVPTGDDIVAQIRSLTELHGSGALSAEQFEAAKAKLLNDA
jgi:hypothetical protein